MAKDRREKKAALGGAPTGEKTVKIAAEPPSYLDRKAAWRISRIQLADPYGWHELDTQMVHYLRAKLACFETMTWDEIFEKAKKQNHPIAVADLKCRTARRWMQKNMPDQPTLWTLRISGAERIWGIFSEGVYQIVFWDPSHLIYPTTR